MPEQDNSNSNNNKYNIIINISVAISYNNNYYPYYFKTTKHRRVLSKLFEKLFPLNYVYLVQSQISYKSVYFTLFFIIVV